MRRARYSNYNAVLMLIAAIGIGFGTMQTFRVGEAERRYDVAQSASWASIYGLSYALTAEQQRAGGFEAQRDRLWNRIARAERDHATTQQWFNAYRAQHGDNRIDWDRYYGDDGQ